MVSTLTFFYILLFFLIIYFDFLCFYVNSRLLASLDGLKNVENLNLKYTIDLSVKLTTIIRVNRYFYAFFIIKEKKILEVLFLLFIIFYLR